MREIFESAQIGRKVGIVALVIVLMTGAFFVDGIWAVTHMHVYTRQGGEVRAEVFGNVFSHTSRMTANRATCGKSRWNAATAAVVPSGLATALPTRRNSRAMSRPITAFWRARRRIPALIAATCGI